MIAPRRNLFIASLYNNQSSLDIKFFNFVYIGSGSNLGRSIGPCLTGSFCAEPALPARDLDERTGVEALSAVRLSAAGSISTMITSDRFCYSLGMNGMWEDRSR